MVDIKKFLPGHEEKDKEEYYWALIIEPGCIQAGIWRIQEDKANIVFVSPPSPWELDEELVNAVDTALSSAIQDFPEEFEEPSKTVFGVASSWVSGGEIKEEHLEKIKKICSELSLTPVGFVVLPEAIAHLVKSEEGSPLSAVVLGVYKENLELSVFRLGKLTGTTQIARSVSLVDDLVEGLSRFASEENIPSRFLLYDGKEGELEDARQTLLRANWEDYDKLQFLHTPKIELEDSKRKVNAVALAGASELAHVTSLTITGMSSEISDEEEEKTWEENPEENVTPEELGFSLDKDVREERKRELKLDEETKVKDAFQEELGDKEHLENIQEVDSSEFLEKGLVSQKKFSFDKVKKGFQSGLLFFKSFSKKLPSLSLGKRPFLFGLGFLLLLVIVGFSLWWFYPKATVTVYVSPKKLEERIDLIVDTGGTSDFSKNLLSGSLVETSVSGDRTKDTSGTKTVGEKAKGEVTIYRVGSQMTLAGGTLLNGPEGLKFVLDSALNIASGSAGTPGTTKASVTAENIGSQYNLASGTTFSVGNYSASDLEAKNESSFSGGTSREINAVSEDDQEALLEELEEELQGKAKSELEGKIAKEKYFVEDSLDATASSKSFSHKVGDEAKTLKLSLSLTTSAVVVERSELVSLASEKLKGKVPEGFILRGEQMNFNFEKKEVEENEYGFSVRISANLLPEVNTENIAKSIRGRYPKLAEEFLTKDVPGFVRAEIKIKPALPGKLKTLPHVTKNIEVEVAADR